MKLETLRDPNTGRLPARAWPGCYPIVYIMGDGAMLCAACANGENGSAAYAGEYDPGRGRDWHMVGADIFWEGPAGHCSHCGAAIESAYGDPEGGVP